MSDENQNNSDFGPEFIKIFIEDTQTNLEFYQRLLEILRHCFRSENPVDYDFLSEIFGNDFYPATVDQAIKHNEELRKCIGLLEEKIRLISGQSPEPAGPEKRHF